MSKPRRSFTPEFKAQVVLDFLSGTVSQAELCRQHRLCPQQVKAWHDHFVSQAPTVFADPDHTRERERIAALERLVGRQALELEVFKKTSTLCSLTVDSAGR